MKPPSQGASELRRFGRPLLRSLELSLDYMSWGVLVMFVAYLLSGITVVRPDEVGVVLRFGGLAGGTPATALRQPGLHFTLPMPIDEVVRVKVEKVYELEIRDLHFPRPAEGDSGPETLTTIDPVVEGYALTGDRNIVQVDMVARYQVDDPVSFALHQAAPQQLLRDSVMAATVRSMGEVKVDSLLSDGRAQFQVHVVQRAQRRLDDANAGIALVSLEITELAPPRHVRHEFDQVQNAFIDIETMLKGAQRDRETAIPEAKADQNRTVREAQSYAAGLLANARGDAGVWRELFAEYRKNPQVVRDRVYLEAVEGSLSKTERLRWVPPPTGARYGDGDFRITIPANPRWAQ